MLISFPFLFYFYFFFLFFQYNSFGLGGFLLGRTLASVMTITFSTSMATRQGPLAMAAHQICLQVWLSVSLLADALAGSTQVNIFQFHFFPLCHLQYIFL